MQDPQETGRRAAIADRIRETLAPVTNLEGLVREATMFTQPSDERAAIAWAASGAVSLDRLAKVHKLVNDVIHNGEPDLVLYVNNSEGTVYLQRWWLERTIGEDGRGQDGMYVHTFEGDDPASLHNHPWPSASLMIQTGLIEESHQGTVLIEPGTLYVRPARFRHRLLLRRGNDNRPLHAMSLFATGGRAQSWGFETQEGAIVEASDSDSLMRTVR